jgi:hypothetical protein
VGEQLSTGDPEAEDFVALLVRDVVPLDVGVPLLLAPGLPLADPVWDAEGVELTVAVWETLEVSDRVVDGVLVVVRDRVTVGVLEFDEELLTLRDLVRDLVGVTDAELHTADPALLVVPEGHTDAVADVDPAGQ